MNGFIPQLVLSTGNVALGFGAGWLVRGVWRSTTRTVNIESADVGSVLDVMHDVESTSRQQVRSWTSLRKSLGEGQGDVALESHACSSTCYGKLLKLNHDLLVRLDPGYSVVPRTFMNELAATRDSVAALADELWTQSERDAETHVEWIFERLIAVEETNLRLLEVLADAHETIRRQTSELATARADAMEDELTKLPNRRAFNERLGELGSANNRHERTFCLLMIDLDEFKQINDLYGHDVGDAILAVTAVVLRESCRRSDHLSRYGGEEFAILAPETTLDGALKLAERIRKRVERTTLEHPKRTIRFTCSIGVAEAGPQGVGQQLLRVADELLYAAKRAGRNCVRCLAATEWTGTRGQGPYDDAVEVSTAGPREIEGR